MWTVVGAALLVVVAACGTKAPEAATVSLEPVTSMGTNPFSPSVGNGQVVTPVPKAGGTVPGNTVGLFGGTQRIASCDPHKLVAFLQAHPDKAAAWASVLGIRPADIPAFVATLTPVILRSDTLVTNHGFVDGHVTSFAAVLQAGTAVLVDRHGNPVTRCACGNPLTAPSLFTKAHFVGPTWVTFNSVSITVIQPVTVVINSFTLVEPATGAAFQRPAGTQGHQDSPAPAPPPTTPPPTTSPPTTAPPTTATPGGPPGTSAPPAPTAPAPPPIPPTTQAPAPSPSTVVPPTTAPAPPTATSPPAGPPTTAAPPPTSKAAPQPSPSTAPSGPAAPSPSPSPSPSAQPPLPVPPPVPNPPVTPSPTAVPETASWAIGTCFVDRRTDPPTFTGALNVRNDDPSGRHSYDVTVTFGASGIQQTVSVPNVEAGQTVAATVTTPGPAGITDPTVPCEITRLVDENGKTPAEGMAIPPPPDTPPPDQPPLTTPPAPTPPPPSVPTEPPVTPPSVGGS